MGDGSFENLPLMLQHLKKYGWENLPAVSGDIGNDYHFPPPLIFHWVHWIPQDRIKAKRVSTLNYTISLNHSLSDSDSKLTKRLWVPVKIFLKHCFPGIETHQGDTAVGFMWCIQRGAEISWWFAIIIIKHYNNKSRNNLKPKKKPKHKNSERNST